MKNKGISRPSEPVLEKRQASCYIQRETVQKVAKIAFFDTLVKSIAIAVIILVMIIMLLQFAHMAFGRTYDRLNDKINLVPSTTVAEVIL